ncbi:MAG: RNA methyltransferase [Myxococcota bacterium]|nr:RNA methyltransferase [Myxococcota bacterium]
MALENIRVVLVEPAHPGNIGAAARAMKTMGLTQLILVRAVHFPSAEADQRASGAEDLLEKAQSLESLREAISDCRLVMGCSARARSFRHTLLNAREGAQQLIEESQNGESVALVFGPERSGLANADLDLCTHQVQIPTDPSFSSLNLGAAVQLLAYEIFLASRPDAPELKAVPNSATRPALQIEMDHFYAHLERVLEERGFLEGELREVTLTKLRRLFTRARPHSGELKLLHSILKLIVPGDGH